MGGWSSSPRMASWRCGCSGRGTRSRANSGGGGWRGRGERGAGRGGGIRAGAPDGGARLTVERCEAAGGEAANRWYTLGVRGAGGEEGGQALLAPGSEG